MRERAAEQRLDQRRDRRLAEEADAERGERDPELAGRQVLAEVLLLGDRAGGAAPARRAPCSSRRPRLARTSANSAATKNPFTRTSTRTAAISSAVMGWRPGGRYFEEGRPARSFAARSVPRPRTGQAPARPSIVAASARSASVMPPALCVESVSAHVVPAVDEDVRVVAGGLGGLRRRAFTSAHRRGEVRELADRARGRRPPGATGRPRSARRRPAAGACSYPRVYDPRGAHREPRPPRHRAAVRARARRSRSSASRTSATTRTRRSTCPTSRATSCPRGSPRARSTRPSASAPRAARRSTRSTSSSLRELEPDLIVTQELCPVCAVSYDEVQARRRAAPRVPEGRRAGPEDVRRDDGRRADDRAGHRVRARGARPDRAPACPRRRGASRPSRTSRCVTVAALEWLDPVFVAGPLDAAAHRARRAASTCSASRASAPRRRRGRRSRRCGPRSSS